MISPVQALDDQEAWRSLRNLAVHNNGTVSPQCERAAHTAAGNPTSKKKNHPEKHRHTQKNIKEREGLCKNVTFRVCASSMQSMSAFPARTTLTKRRDPRATVQPAQRDNDVTTPTSIHNVHPRTPTILVVDNDPLTMHLAAAVLHRAGYDILRATSGTQALSIAYQPAAHVDLLITAASMPHMSGTYLADLLLARDPQLRVLFLTSTEETRTTKTSAQQRGPTFQKPFTTDGLLDVIATTLGKPFTRAAT